LLIEFEELFALTIIVTNTMATVDFPGKCFFFILFFQEENSIQLRFFFAMFKQGDFRQSEQTLVLSDNAKDLPPPSPRPTDLKSLAAEKRDCHTRRER
jgi:hypothetical protein